MALRAVIDHPKYKRLKAILKCGMREALGTLEGLWHFCGRYTPQGNIGKYADADIEAWLEWDGEEGALIAALVKARWLDADPEHRLIVHDWHIHADAATKLSLKRAGLEFVVPTLSEQCSDSVTTVWSPPEPEPVPVPEPEPDTPKPPRGFEQAAVSVIEYFNTRTGRRLDPAVQSKFAIPRLKAGSTPDDLRLVIDFKCDEWSGGEMSRFIRPETLFRASHFDEYLESARAWKSGTTPNGKPKDEVAAMIARLEAEAVR